MEWLRDFRGLVQDLSISGDKYHGGEDQLQRARNACEAARKIGIPAGTIAIAPPEADVDPSFGQIHDGESAVMFRGRAAAKLADRAGSRPWGELNECPHEDLREPGRVPPLRRGATRAARTPATTERGKCIRVR